MDDDNVNDKSNVNDKDDKDHNDDKDKEYVLQRLGRGTVRIPEHFEVMSSRLVLALSVDNDSVILAVDCMYTSSNRINTKELVDEDRLLGWRLYKRRCVGRSESQSVDA